MRTLFPYTTLFRSESGQVDVQALANLIDDRVKLISMSHVPTGGGLVNPAAAVGAVARAANVPYLLDACQTVGQLPLDVQAIGCDMLSATGRKYLRGPRGTGFLYVRSDWIERLDPPLLDQHAAWLVSESAYEVRGDARRFENWEQYFAGKAALGTAVDYALAWGLEAIRDRVYALADRLRAGLTGLDGVTVTDEGIERCGIVTFYTERVSAPELQRALAADGINVSVSDGSGSFVSFQRRGLDQLVRASVHYFNTEEEVERFVAAVRASLG